MNDGVDCQLRQRFEDQKMGLRKKLRGTAPRILCCWRWHVLDRRS